MEAEGEISVERHEATGGIKITRETPDNQQGVRSWTVEQFVKERRERLQPQLAQHHGLDEYTDADVYKCVACGATENVHICPGPELDDLQYRCDDCGAEFTGLFGVTFWIDHGQGHTTENYCLRCVWGIERFGVAPRERFPDNDQGAGE